VGTLAEFRLSILLISSFNYTGIQSPEHGFEAMAAPLAILISSSTLERSRISDALTAANWRQMCGPPGDAEAVVARHPPDVVIVSASATDSSSAIDCLSRLHAAFNAPRYLFVAAVSSEELAIAALHAGADQYLKEPWTPEKLLGSLAALMPRGDATSCCDSLSGGDRLVGRSPAMAHLRAQIKRVAPASSNVLILGETGTGKELVAELIHQNGSRSGKPFICINTAAIPDALLENELFGHERGAFTGATTTEQGKLAAAHGGTMFLDEIGDVSLAIQAKLLRAIENKAIYRLGSTRSVQLDVRVVAATNGDLLNAIANGRFRRDLYYRLNVVQLDVPPLRERPDDIPPLIAHYLVRFNRELGRSVRGLSARALDALCGYPWPGNVRELRNVVEALLVNLAPETTGVVDVPPEVMRRLALAVGAPLSERDRLLGALAETNWNKTRAASKLRMSRMTLYRKMQRHAVGTRH
jgi:DNA-binding NtrC family response regulator